MSQYLDVQAGADWAEKWGGIEPTNEDVVANQIFDPITPALPGESRPAWARMLDYGFSTAVDTIAQVQIEKARMKNGAYQITGAGGTVSPRISGAVQGGQVRAEAQIPAIYLAAAAALLWFLMKR